ncbi:MAG: response regulator [Acidobacteriota bacterium]|nr:response regulator [Acidobacteriota bacterium]
MSDARAAAQRPPILVIEDEASVAGFLRSALERHGDAVIVSSSAADGLQLLASRDFRGVISDVRTPGAISGAEVQEWLQRHRPALATRFVFITGDTARPETALLLAEANAPCIKKPFRLQQLLTAVEGTIGKP